MTMFNGVVLVQLITVAFDIFWWYTIVYCIFGYLIVSVSDNGGNINAGVIFVLLLSLYWTNEVNANLSHTSCCGMLCLMRNFNSFYYNHSNKGVAAVWFFSPESDMTWSHFPTFKAFVRSMTTSFGSICFGSLLVSIVHLIRAMITCGCRNWYLLCISLGYCRYHINECVLLSMYTHTAAHVVCGCAA